MTTLKIVGEGESLAEARKQVKREILSIMGPLLKLDSKIISDGKPKTIRSVAQTVEEAFEKARKDVPADGEVLDKKVYLSSGKKEFTIEALDEEDAKKRAKKRIDDTASLRSVELASPGRKGVFGIGRKLSIYKVQVFQRAVVEIIYKKKAKIITTVVTPGDRLEEFERLVTELISIGVTQGYFGKGPSFYPEGRGMERRKNIRARKIGEELYEMGGKDLMKLAWHIVKKSPADEIDLEHAWINIGGWLP
ncbi:hypothetical protein [Candidatus Hecatella orcuttiae]|jgi:MoaA/NifB/PqqE/SkfB family radical SAM enzyme|uniref:hypothetical protein n=1 Tax=Candidatus Hecatella orcuttiae TaxID=1935119 RepID=UPI002867BCD8|nr:hypothetical protein [Candidatus Hecatella orcuttiae]